MKPGRECPQCGKVLADRFQLYRHTINVHHRRFCWYCPHEEGRPRRLRVHIQRHHPGVPVEEMSNEALWRSGDDEIIPAPASVIVVPRPMELAPDVQRPADGQREVVQEEAIASDVAAEVVVGEERAVREGTVEDVVRGEAVADESSGSWREIEEIDIREPLSSMGEEGISHSELSAAEATEESSGSRHVEVVGMDEPPVPAGGMGASHSDGLEVGCARVLSVEEYRERRLRNTTRREVRSGVATFVATSGTDCTMTPVIPEIVEEDTRRVVPRGDVGSTCRKSRSRKRKSHSQGRERSQSRQRSGADSSSDTGRVIRKVAPDEKQRANNDKCETATEGDIRRVVPRGDVGSTCRKSSSKKRRSSSHRRSQSPRGSSLAGAALQAVLSSPRVRLVDCFPVSFPRGPGSNGNSAEGDKGDAHLTSPGSSVSPVTDDRAGRPVFSELSDPAESVSDTPVSSVAAISAAESVESFVGWVSAVPAGSNVPLRSSAETPACQCRCHNRQGSCCPCRCVCSHKDAACQTT